MTKAEKAEQYFRNAVSDAMAYMSEAKTACGSDMQQLEYYDLAAKALRRIAEDDKAREEGRVLPGKSVCVSTCGGKRLTIVVDVEAALGEERGE